MEGKIGIMIGYKDRPTELSLLLQSLRTQTYKNFEIFISDDCSGTPIQAYHFLMCLFNKLNEEGNFVHYSRNDFNLGVSKNRQKLVDTVMADKKFDLLSRLDDDIILDPHYFEKLLTVLDKGYDLATGVTPFIGQAQFRRESKFMQPVGNRVILDKEGNFIMNGDDFGIQYLDEDILPIHHFRSCALYKRELHNKVSYDNRLTKHGFREEEILSFKLIVNGFTMGVNTKAIAWHLLTPSGGERTPDAPDLTKINEEELKRFTKELYLKHGDFIQEYNKKLNIKADMPSHEELLKPTNLIRL